MTFGDRVQSITREVILPKVVDNVLNSNVLAFRMVSNAKKGEGYSVKRAIKLTNSNQFTSFAGLDTFTAVPLDTKKKMEYDMRASRQPVGVGGLDIIANRGEAKVVDLVKNTMEESEEEMIDGFGTMLYGDGTGNDNKDCIGLGAIVDDGSNVGTIGGLSRTTYPQLKATVTASNGTLTLAKMASLYTAVSSGSTKSTPTLAISDEATWDLYEQLLTPTVRHNYSSEGYYQVGRTGGAVRGGSHDGQVGQGGFVAISYKGVPYVRDEKATAQTLFFLNENYLDWYGWDAAVPELGYSKISLSSDTVDGLYAEEPMSQFMGFGWSGLRAPVDQFSGIGDLILVGNLVSWQPRRQGKLTGITSI